MAAAAVLLVIVVFFNAVMGDKSAADGETDQQSIFLSNQPEFFSTIRPESLNTAEIDTADDLAKAASYFENSLFVGDRQMEYIHNSTLENERAGAILSGALFMTAEGYTWKAMAEEFSGGALTFNLYGDYVSMTGAIEKVGAETVFLQLGRADLAAGDISTALYNAQVALLSLKQAAPQTEIIVLALTPNTAESTAVPDNSTIQAFNNGMHDFCGEAGIVFADTASVFSSDGLPTEYCADPDGEGIYLNTEGGLVWVNALLDIVSAPRSTPAPTAMPTENSGTQTASNGVNAAGRGASVN